MSPAQLRAEWAAVCNTSAPNISPDLLRLGIAFELQRKASGKEEKSLARLLRQQPTPAMRPGTELVRTWNGRTIRVRAIDDGFLFEDRTWKSLSAIAREVTGTAWSGPRFFGLNGRG
jgi:hypothetical protein